MDRGNDQPGRQPQSNQRRFRQLQARFDGFRHRIRDANRIEMARVGGIARTRDDSDVRSQRADLFYNFVDCGLSGNRDDYSSRVCKATTP
jgi:hypothetical protein